MRFVVLSLGFLGWGFYELSGGADFVPETRPVAAVEMPVQLPKLSAEPKLDDVNVTLAALVDPVLVSPDLDTPIAQDTVLVTEAVEVAISNIDDDTAPITLAGIAAEPDVAPTTEPLDIRYVVAQRLNVRAGPSTNHAVVGTLLYGEETLVVAVSAIDGEWVQIRVEGDGVEGFIAARFLTQSEPNG